MQGKRVYFWMLLLLFACGKSKTIGYSHLLQEKKIKNKETQNLPLQFVFYRNNDTLTTVFYRITPEHFLPKYDSLKLLSTNCRIELEVKAHQFGNRLLEPCVQEKRIIGTTAILDSFQLVLPSGKNVYFEWKIIDLHKHVFRNIAGFWTRNTAPIAEDILLIDSNTQNVYTNSFVSDAPIQFRSELTSSVFELEMYKNLQNPAQSAFEIENNPLFQKQVPFAKVHGNLTELANKINEQEHDTYFRIFVQSDRQVPSLNFTKLTSKPIISIEPLVYLLPKNESLTAAVYSKFWLDAAKNDVRMAKNLIAEFNKRVQFANDYFSSHKLGWKTDRGRMYILHGAPDRVTADVRSEIWTYGFQNTINQVFTFDRNPTGIHPDDFILERNTLFRETELNAIERWKNGWVKMD